MGQVIIYAELNKKQYSRIINGEYGLELPEGITLKNKAGSRGLFFTCENNKLAQILEDALTSDGISYNIINESLDNFYGDKNY